MNKSAIKSLPTYFNTYVDLVEDQPLMELLENGGIDLFLEHKDQLKALGNKTYAEGKWTVNEMIEHIMDTERIFVNRSLRFARNDKTDLPGYDHDLYVAASRSNDIPLETLLEQFKAIRKCTVATFENFNEEELMRTGKANGMEISVLGLGFVQIGHPIHHFNILKERYFPLIDN